MFAISDPEKVLYECVYHDQHCLVAHPVGFPALKQVFTQDEFRALVNANKVDPRRDQNSDTRRRIRARNPGIATGRDLSDAEQKDLNFYYQVARRVHDMHQAGETALTDKALRKTIPKVIAEIWSSPGSVDS